MTISIIIAVKTWQKNLEECAAKCRKLDFADFEIIILPDTREGFPSLPAQIVPTGPLSPAKKRDIALEYAKGEILAFIDDDAYPAGDWLKNAMPNFQDNEVAAVGGPAVTPDEDSLRQKASGEVYASRLVSAGFVYRYGQGRRKEVDDFPSCNFLVRSSAMRELGGFHTDFWPGEDTKLCLDIVKKLRKKIIYDPRVLVYHHRRPLFKAHLNQVANYALHRGYFVKKYPETSLRLAYFAPSLFLSAVILGSTVSGISSAFSWAYLSAIFFYLGLALLFSLRKDLRLTPLVFCGIIFSHFTYGAFFLKGLFSRALREDGR
ncbi:MAG: glycosyltransferase [Candidatus Omnitrophota bacterium]|nr:glycosyltransferase [Candidatus Omnitrophota bacterium]